MVLHTVSHARRLFTILRCTVKSQRQYTFQYATNFRTTTIADLYGSIWLKWFDWNGANRKYIKQIKRSTLRRLDSRTAGCLRLKLGTNYPRTRVHGPCPRAVREQGCQKWHPCARPVCTARVHDPWTWVSFFDTHVHRSCPVAREHGPWTRVACTDPDSSSIMSPTDLVCGIDRYDQPLHLAFFTGDSPSSINWTLIVFTPVAATSFLVAVGMYRFNCLNFSFLFSVLYCRWGLSGSDTKFPYNRIFNHMTLTVDVSNPKTIETEAWWETSNQIFV